MVAYAVGITIEVLVLSGSANMKLVELLIPTLWFPTYLPVYIPLAVWLFIMVSMLFEDISHSQGDDVLRFFKATTSESLKSQFKALEILFFCVSLVGGFTLMFTDTVPLSFLGSSLSLYCLLAAIIKP
jgi:hypothetical protein